MTFKYTMLLSCALVCAPISFTQASSSLPFQGINLSADETGQDGWGVFLPQRGISCLPLLRHFMTPLMPISDMVRCSRRHKR